MTGDEEQLAALSNDLPGHDDARFWRGLKQAADVYRIRSTMPHDYPHWNTVYAYFAGWQEEAVFDQLNTLLRRQVRRQEGREGEPTA